MKLIGFLGARLARCAARIEGVWVIEATDNKNTKYVIAAYDNFKEAWNTANIESTRLKKFVMYLALILVVSLYILP